MPAVPLTQLPGGLWTSPNAAWAALIARESGGDPSIIQQAIDANTGGNEASGLFQIAKGTWAAHGGTEFAPTAGEATPQQQAIVAARIIHRNPTGSDWGAGLPGRESAAELVAGAAAGVPVAGGVPFGLTSPEQLASVPWVQQLEQTYGLEARTRPGHQTTNRAEAGFAPNPSGLIRGIDWYGTPAEMDAFAEALIADPTGIEQLIYMSPLTGKKYGIAGGRVVGDDYYADDWAGHTDHVHTRSSTSLLDRRQRPESQSLSETATSGTSETATSGTSAAGKAGETMGQALGQGLVKGMFEELGFPDVFGPDPTQWGIWKLAMGGLGYAEGLAKQAAKGPGGEQAVTAPALLESVSDRCRPCSAHDPHAGTGAPPGPASVPTAMAPSEPAVNVPAVAQAVIQGGNSYVFQNSDYQTAQANSNATTSRTSTSPGRPRRSAATRRCSPPEVSSGRAGSQRCAWWRARAGREGLLDDCSGVVAARVRAARQDLVRAAGHDRPHVALGGGIGAMTAATDAERRLWQRVLWVSAATLAHGHRKRSVARSRLFSASTSSPGRQRHGLIAIHRDVVIARLVAASGSHGDLLSGSNASIQASKSRHRLRWGHRWGGRVR